MRPWSGDEIRPIVEIADADTLFAAPTHPYARELIEFVPRIDRIGTRLAPQEAPYV